MCLAVYSPACKACSCMASSRTVAHRAQDMQVAIVLGGNSKPSQEEAHSVLEAAQQRFAAICALLHGRVAAGAGPSLRSATAAAGKGLLQACQAFLDSLHAQVRSPFLASLMAHS